MSRAGAVFHCPFCGDENLWPHEVEATEKTAAPRGAAWECRSCQRAFTVSFLGQLRRTVPGGGEGR